MAFYLRRKVSLKKRRYQQDGFDLDLTYITDNVITMGFPSVGYETMFRNPRKDVKRFFEKKHPEKYKVYNLCAEPERQYQAAVFKSRVSCYPFYDHQAPPIHLMGEFCRDVEAWMNQNDGNAVAAIHCKAGKGRAGMMACCYLVHSRFSATAIEAMDYYANKRTKNAQGVTIPSQRRYVMYYEDIRNYGMPEQPIIKMSTLVIPCSKYVNPSKSQPYVEIYSKGTELLFKSTPQATNGHDVTIECKDVAMQGDIKVVVYDVAVDPKKEAFHFWFNTAWIHENKLVLTRKEIDKAFNDKKFKKFTPEFSLTATFNDAEVSAIEKLKATKVTEEPTQTKAVVVLETTEEKKESGKVEETSSNDKTVEPSTEKSDSKSEKKSKKSSSSSKKEKKSSKSDKRSDVTKEAELPKVVVEEKSDDVTTTTTTTVDTPVVAEPVVVVSVAAVEEPVVEEKSDDVTTTTTTTVDATPAPVVAESAAVVVVETPSDEQKNNNESVDDHHHDNEENEKKESPQESDAANTDHNNKGEDSAVVAETPTVIVVESESTIVLTPSTVVEEQPVVVQQEESVATPEDVKTTPAVVEPPADLQSAPVEEASN